MNIKRCFQPVAQSKMASWGLLLLRIVAGLAFVYHGWGKMQNPFGWMGPAPVPGFLQFLAAWSEFAGGIAWILGFLTPLASLGLFFTMLVATHHHAIVAGDPFVGTGGPSYELALLYLSLSVLFLTAGPGRFSIDSGLFKERIVRS